MLRSALGRDVAGLTDGAGGDVVAVAVFVEEGEHDDVDAGGGGAVGREVVVLDGAAWMGLARGVIDLWL